MSGKIFHFLKNQPVSSGIKILRNDVFSHILPMGVIQHNPSQNCLLRLYGMWWNSHLCSLFVMRWGRLLCHKNVSVKYLKNSYIIYQISCRFKGKTRKSAVGFLRVFKIAQKIYRTLETVMKQNYLFTSRRAVIASERDFSRISVSSQPIQASVILCP